MFLHQTFVILLLLLSLVPSCHALRCTTNCSFTYNITDQPLIIPDSCNQVQSAGKCLARLAFTYDLQIYFFDLTADTQTTIFGSNNQRRAKLQLFLPTTVYLSHFVDIACKDKDDCARDLMIKTAAEMLQRRYRFPQILDELQPFILGPPLSSNNPQLNCYDAKQKPQACATLTNPGSCFLANQILNEKISPSCKTDSFNREISINMYQDKKTATFDIRCNRNLCNAQSTLTAVKEILFRHNITRTPDGRLSGSTLHISLFLLITMLFGVLSNRFEV